MTTPKTCAYTYEFTGFRCTLPAWEGHDTLMCILHDPHPGKPMERFNAALEEKVMRDEADDAAREINLAGVAFPTYLDWSGRTVGKPVSFRKASFSGAADFSRATFRGDADFWGATFHGDAAFTRATFCGAAHFYQATFSADAVFSGARFSGNASFSEATFHADANFWKAGFNAAALFSEATFRADAYFSESSFGGFAFFSEATFNGVANFGGATFSGDASFTGATFSGAAYFSEATFSGTASFSWATFKESVSFEGTRFPPRDSRYDIGFERVTFQRPSVTYFWHVDLSRASFLYTDVREVKFMGVTWASLPEHALWPLPLFKRWKAGRHGIRSHLELEEARRGRAAPGSPQAAESPDAKEQREEVLRTHRSVAEQYRLLRLNYETSKQEIEAGDFYIGQMDMRRLDNDNKEYPWLYRALLNGYRTVALYGESYLRPLIFYLAFSLLFAWGYQWRGCASYADGLFTALTAGALFRDVPVCIDDAEKILVYFNMLADILLLGLALVAMRRRFHR